VIIEILAGVAAKLASLTVAAKAAVGIGVATAAIGAVGVTGVVPVPGIDTAGSNAAVEVQLPSVPTANADLGLQVANDAINANVSATAGKPDVTGLARAAQTPAADHLPSVVPGPPASVPPANTNAATTGLDRAAQTPAADHLPSFVPGPPAGIPTGGAPTGAPGATGIDIAKQTPAAGRLPR
jgi:hypothetical protein